MLGREGELEAAGRLIGEPSSRLLGDVRRMIIKDQVDRRMGWIGRVEKLEKLDELTAAMAILDQGVNLTGQQIDAALDRLMMQSEPAPHCKKRRILSIRQQYPRPLDPACPFRSRMRYRSQLRRICISERQLDRPPPRCHVLQPLVPKLLIHI